MMVAFKVPRERSEGDALFLLPTEMPMIVLARGIGSQGDHALLCFPKQFGSTCADNGRCGVQKVFGRYQTGNDADKVEKLLIFEKSAPQREKTKSS